MRPTMTEIITIAIIHPIRAFTSPRPPPRIWRIIPPDHVTRSEYSNPVVARNSAELEAMSVFIYLMVN